MTPLRVLIVEDSLTMRMRLRDVLESDPGLEVIGLAADGKEAVELCCRLRPDVMTLDMMLPVMSGLAVTEYLMAHCPTPILIVSSSTNRGELFKTYEALAAGAVDVLDKPLGVEPDGDWERRLIQAVKLVARIKVITHLRARLDPLMTRTLAQTLVKPRVPRRTSGYKILVIGASTGGPGAIVEVLRALPAGFSLPCLIVLHIGEPFGASFADWLDGQTVHRIRFAEEGQPVHGCGIVLAPPGRHLLIRNEVLRFSDEPERHSCRPAVDVLFESVAREMGESTIACLLTGMGCDGAYGMLQIRHAGGLTIAQDEASSVVYGMPREAVKLGAAEYVLPLAEIGTVVAATVI